MFIKFADMALTTLPNCEKKYKYYANTLEAYIVLKRISMGIILSRIQDGRHKK